MLENTKKFCDSFLKLGVPGFDLAVYKEGQCVLRHMNGYSDPKNKIKINGKERYNIYSCSKGITVAAALQLMERGLFSLDDELSRYMPEFSRMTVIEDGVVRNAKKPILIKHLFEMTAGFSYNCSSPQLIKAREQTSGRCPTREVMRYLAKEPLLFDPGERWLYSLCHDVLAALVEVLSGQSFQEYVKENIFDVLGMTHSTFMLPENELDTLAPQYQFENGRAVNVGKDIVCFKLGSEYASGGAGCISTVDDYMLFLEGLRTNKLISPQTLDLMMTNRLNQQQMSTFTSNSTHGYGLGVRCPDGKEGYVDFGWGGAAGAYWAIDVQNQISIYFATHLLASPAQGIRSKLYRFVRTDLLDTGDLDDLYRLLDDLYDYKFTY